MRDRGTFVAAMGSLALNCRIEVSEQQLELYWQMLGDLSDEDFTRAVAVSLQTSRFFPTIAELRQTVTPYSSPQAEAGLAFERVSGLGQYSPQGYRWNIRIIAQVVGPCAAEAFAAAGGSRAFEQEQGERNLPFLRNRFIDAYTSAREAQRQGRELVVAGAHRLPSGAPARSLVEATVRELSMPESSR